MSTPFAQSQTRLNLLRSFAGESQARNRYTFAASVAKKNKLEVIESVFLFTAGQEQAHAKVFYDLLSSESGQNIAIDGSYPIDIFDDVLQYLRAAQHNEYQEHDVDYAQFAQIAGQEGFDTISHTFGMIAGVEKTHGDRFGRFADLLEQNKLFVSDVETGWMCLNCGQIVHSTVAPALCPVCKHGQGYFIRLEMAPFTCGACNQG
ncbi:MAG: rubrerythrin family protein [Oscillospiraceae bacterium]|nr:rubrerythrin family protein [Oscillospiraceae bacterium]